MHTDLHRPDREREGEREREREGDREGERRERERERGEATVDMKKHSLDQTCSPQVSTEVMDRQRKDKQQV